MTKVSPNTNNTVVKHATLGFGVPATSDPHHFKVIIPKNNTGKVQINEYLGLQALSEEFSIVERVLLDRTRWMAVRAEVQRAFNARLKSYSLNTSSWQVGENVVDRLLGKELCVLAWAIESMEIDNIPLAVRNWLALRPEERWWLFGMAAKSTGGVDDRDVGWRIALRHALGDIVQAEHSDLSHEPDISIKRHTAKSDDIHSLPERDGNLPDINEVGLLPKDTSNKDVLSQKPDGRSPAKEQAQSLLTIEETYFLFEVKLAKAIGQPIGDKSSPEFLVKKGSTANKALAKSLRPAIRELRQQLIDNDILVKDGAVYAFAHEYVFKSPSAAACVIAGNPRSGMDAWKDMQGHSLKDLGYGKKE